MIGTKLGAATFVFEWASLAGVFACAAAAAALARRLGPYPAAPLAALFTLCLPGALARRPARRLERDCTPRSSWPRPLRASARRRARDCSLVAGTLRPEAGPRRAISAIFGWRKATPATRALSIASLVGPPALWISLDNAFTGDWWWSSQHRRRLQRPLPSSAARPHRPARRGSIDSGRRRLDLAGRGARGRGARRRPAQAAVRRGRRLPGGADPGAPSWSSCAGRSRPTTWAGNWRRALAVFAAATGAAGRGRGATRPAADAARWRSSRSPAGAGGGGAAARGGAPRATAGRARRARRGRSRRSSRRPALEREAPARVRRAAAPVGGASSRSRGTGRASSFIPARAIEDGHDGADKRKVGGRARDVPADGRLPRWIRQVALTHDWRAGVREKPCTT